MYRSIDTDRSKNPSPISPQETEPTEFDKTVLSYDPRKQECSMLCDHCLRILIGLLVAMLMPPGFAQAQVTKTPPPNRALCIECLKIRVGLPRVARGPAGNTVDNTFSEIKLPNGQFRGFTAVGNSYAIDGNTPWDMGGRAVEVLKPGAPGSMATCGQWLIHVEPVGKTLLGWVHQETACHYGNPTQSHMSMSLATSTDNGLTWQVEGFIITGKENDKPADGWVTGESCNSAVDGEDGYYYASCERQRDRVSYVARAPVSDPGPGNWKKYFNGAWSQPGVGGDASKSGSGSILANWPSIGEMVSLIYQPRTRAPGDKTPAPGAIHLAFSKDHLNFTIMREPLALLDGGGWARPNPYELLDYWSLLDAHTGSNKLSGDQWNLFYMDLQPNESFDKRYLVARPIVVSQSRQDEEPQVGVILGHWYNAARHEHWSTIAAVPGNYTDYKLEAQSGYLMTVADAKRPSVELEDCVSQQGVHLDHILMPTNTCQGRAYKRQRTVGWVFSTPQPRTQPLYSCYSEAEKSHFAANSHHSLPLWRLNQHGVQFCRSGQRFLFDPHCEWDARPLLEHIHRCVIARRREKIWRSRKSDSVELHRVFPV
jgi:hypothetical protein